MNRRDFLKGFAAIAVTSPFAVTSYGLPEKEIIKPSPHTLISGTDLYKFINIETPLIDIYLPHDGDDDFIDVYIQTKTGHTMYIGSGEPGTIIQCAQITPEPFRLISDKQSPDKSTIVIKPRYYEIIGRKVMITHGETIKLTVRRFH